MQISIGIVKQNPVEIVARRMNRGTLLSLNVIKDANRQEQTGITIRRNV